MIFYFLSPSQNVSVSLSLYTFWECERMKIHVIICLLSNSNNNTQSKWISDQLNYLRNLFTLSFTFGHERVSLCCCQKYLRQFRLEYFLFIVAVAAISVFSILSSFFFFNLMLTKSLSHRFLHERKNKKKNGKKIRFFQWRTEFLNLVFFSFFKKIFLFPQKPLGKPIF